MPANGRAADVDLLTIAKRLLPVRRDTGGWNLQRTYDGPFPYLQSRPDDADLTAMLRQEHWIGCRSRASGQAALP